MIQTKKGMSLLELLIAMFILGIVTVGMSSFFAYLWRSKAVEISRGQSILVASNSVNKMVRFIRKSAQAESGAYMLDSGDDFEFIFYSDTDNDGYLERIHYYLEGDSLKMGTAEPILGTNPTYPVGDEVTVEIADDIVNDTSTEPIFTYFDNNGVAMTTPVNVYAVKAVKITVFVNSDPENINDVEINSMVALRNVNV
ncbi:MAG: prepilin-type N-terminal cleavage/methylation domain-containing protein [Candidatus Moranbacteria bacterium]|nr:prepilin-type N-terminal cleavage/methylation domain-containing protein [Candidatus Moranbacteria bacterium]